MDTTKVSKFIVKVLYKMYWDKQLSNQDLNNLIYKYRIAEQVKWIPALKKHFPLEYKEVFGC